MPKIVLVYCGYSGVMWTLTLFIRNSTIYMCILTPKFRKNCVCCKRRRLTSTARHEREMKATERMLCKNNASTHFRSPPLTQQIKTSRFTNLYNLEVLLKDQFTLYTTALKHLYEQLQSNYVGAAVINFIVR